MKIEYTKVGDYNLPNITLKVREKLNLSKYGKLKQRYMKEHQKIMYTNLLTSGELHDYLAMIDEQANAVYDRMLIDLKAQRNITEELKERNQLKWIQEMNNVDACINEIIYDEFIYN